MSFEQCIDQNLSIFCSGEMVHPDAPCGGIGCGFSRPQGPHRNFIEEYISLHPETTPDERFKEKAIVYMRLLIRDLDITDLQAAAIVGNLALESGKFQIFHQIGSRPGQGGFGTAQWTVPSRRQGFFDWANQNGGMLTAEADWISYSYIIKELNTQQFKKVVPNLKSYDNLDEAVEYFMKAYEKPSTEQLQKRKDDANTALDSYRDRLGQTKKYIARKLQSRISPYSSFPSGKQNDPPYWQILDEKYPK